MGYDVLTVFGIVLIIKATNRLESGSLMLQRHGLSASWYVINLSHRKSHITLSLTGWIRPGGCPDSPQTPSSFNSEQDRMETRKLVSPSSAFSVTSSIVGRCFSLTTKLPFEDDEFDHVHIQSIAAGVPENKVGAATFSSTINFDKL